MNEKSCYAIGCKRGVAKGNLFCFYCWVRLSKPTQHLIYSTWEALQKAGFRSDNERKAYLDARVKACKELRGAP